MSVFPDAKLVLVQATELSKDARHVYVGLGVMLLVAILLRRPLRNWRTTAAVARGAVGGAIWEVLESCSTGGGRLVVEATRVEEGMSGWVLVERGGRGCLK